ncbi:hypothetical protein T01_5060 [Trichinella spiralis]|uniref:Uncharacterized protein n=1 Tax=Trichinella spiralis TaxID=6334 RepID=A0A0V1BSD3_TRISP|nr:hypothetical protein T01_5060 [Trichinella spiralis]
MNRKKVLNETNDEEKKNQFGSNSKDRLKLVSRLDGTVAVRGGQVDGDGSEKWPLAYLQTTKVGIFQQFALVGVQTKRGNLNDQRRRGRGRVGVERDTPVVQSPLDGVERVDNRKRFLLERNVETAQRRAGDDQLVQVVHRQTRVAEREAAQSAALCQQRAELPTAAEPTLVQRQFGELVEQTSQTDGIHVG